MDEINRKRGPGLYDIELGGFKPEAVESRSAGPGWAREYEMKRLAALPHLLHKDQWEARRLLAKKLGPGSYDIKDFKEMDDLIPRSKIGICGYLGKRMGSAFKEKTPGPGTYGEGGVPHSGIEEKATKSTSTIGMLDAATSGKRDLPTVGCHLGPGNYNFKGSTDMLRERQVSTRGPYDLFSLDRNKPIKTGHHAKFGGSTLGPREYDMKSFTDNINTYNNKKKGEFGKTEQHPEKAERIYFSTLSQVPMPEAADRPGPTSYDPKINYPKPQNHGNAGFLSDSARNDKRSQRFFTGNFNSVGAGRYEVQKFHESRHRNGHESVFKSKVGRLAQHQEFSFRERIREKDVQKADRVHLLKPQKPPYYYPNNLTDHYSQTKSITIG